MLINDFKELLFFKVEGEVQKGHIGLVFLQLNAVLHL